MYSTYKLNKQSDNIQPWCTPFPIWNQSVVPCPVLTVSSSPAYKFLRRQVRWSGCQIAGETVEIVADFTLGGLQNHCRWCFQPWNKKTLTPWKESYDQLRQHIKKQRYYFANKGPSSQSYGFSRSHYGCASWTIKKAECWRIDALELWCWRRLLRVPWTARRSNQSILK